MQPSFGRSRGIVPPAALSPPPPSTWLGYLTAPVKSVFSKVVNILPFGSGSPALSLQELMHEEKIATVPPSLGDRRDRNLTAEQRRVYDLELAAERAAATHNAAVGEARAVLGQSVEQLEVGRRRSHGSDDGYERSMAQHELTQARYAQTLNATRAAAIAARAAANAAASSALNAEVRRVQDIEADRDARNNAYLAEQHADERAKANAMREALALTSKAKAAKVARQREEAERVAAIQAAEKRAAERLLAAREAEALDARVAARDAAALAARFAARQAEELAAREAEALATRQAESRQVEAREAATRRAAARQAAARRAEAESARYFEALASAARSAEAREAANRLAAAEARESAIGRAAARQAEAESARYFAALANAESEARQHDAIQAEDAQYEGARNRSFHDYSAPAVYGRWRLIDPALEVALGELSRHGLGATSASLFPQQSQKGKQTRLETQTQHKNVFPVQFEKAFGTPAQELRLAFEQHGLNAVIDPTRLREILTLHDGHPDIPKVVADLNQLSKNNLVARPLETDAECCICRRETVPEHTSEDSVIEELPMLVCHQCKQTTCLNCVQELLNRNKTECPVCRSQMSWWLNLFTI